MMKLRIICLLLLAFAFQSAHAQEAAPISPGVFMRGLQIASGIRYTASFIKPTDDAAMRNLSVEVTLPADAQFTEMLVSRQVEFDVIRRNRQGQLTLIWQISRVASDVPLDAFAFTVASPLSQELEFYLHWQDEQGQTFVENFFELPSTLRADAPEGSLTPANADFVLAGNSGILVSSASPNPLNFRVLPNNFNPPAEYGRIWWCSLVELSGLGESESATVIVPLRRPVAPFTELILFQQQADQSWLELDETGVVTADGQFVMYQHPGGLIATGGDEKIQQEVVKAEDAKIEDEAPREEQESESSPQNESEPQPQNESEPEPAAPAEDHVEAPPQQDSPPESNQGSSDGTSNTIIISEATSAPPPAQNNNDGTSNTIIISEPTSAPLPAPTQGGVSDGSSNTIIISEATSTPAPTLGSISDGSSNTIIISEASVTPAPTLGSISDGSSNTIIISEATSTPAPTLGSISDGSSNTIIISEATSTPTPVPAQAAASSTPVSVGKATLSPVPTQVVSSKPIPAPFGAGGVRVVILRSNTSQFVQCQVGSILCTPLQRRAGAGLLR